jgi:acetyltransferase-like isoleucine patch superfamily enzyme
MDPGGRLRRAARMGWAALSWYVVESIVFALAVLPAALFWLWHFERAPSPLGLEVLFLALSFVPAYVVFAIGLMALSALSTRLLGWRTPPDAEMPIAELGWPLLRWVRYAAINHVVRVFTGSFLRSTPLWTMYLRLNGARLGRGVYVNTVSIMDHNLIEFDDGVVIGSDVHVAGHTVEAGIVRTAPVRIGRNATIGIGSVIGIGVVIGEEAQVGALSVVPKFRVLEPGSIHAGVPIRRIHVD